MKIFISYKHHGENDSELKAVLEPIVEKFQEIGAQAYCNLFDYDLNIRSKGFKEKDWVMDAFSKIDEMDFVFVLQRSEERSEGMLLEVGYSVAKKIPVIIAVKEGVNKTYLPQMADLVIKWNDQEDLLKKILEIDFNNLK